MHSSKNFVEVSVKLASVDFQPSPRGKLIHFGLHMQGFGFTLLQPRYTAL
jgi:hypothetical protein